MRNGTSQSPFRPALGRQLVRAADAPLRGHGFGTSRLRQTPTTNGLTAYRMRLHLACVSSGTYGPFATSASRSRLRLPRTTRLALRASLAGSDGYCLKRQSLKVYCIHRIRPVHADAVRCAHRILPAPLRRVFQITHQDTKVGRWIKRIRLRVSPCSGCETGHPSPPFALRSGDNLYVPRTPRSGATASALRASARPLRRMA